MRTDFVLTMIRFESLFIQAANRELSKDKPDNRLVGELLDAAWFAERIVQSRLQS